MRAMTASILGPDARRRAGVLLHPTSLPGPPGIGDLGPSADRFLDWLVEASQSVWQILPLGPPAIDGTPYTTLSSFAGNPNLISLELLVDDGLLSPEEIEPPPSLGSFDPSRAAYGLVEPWKDDLLRRAARRLLDDRDGALSLDAFRAAPAQAVWLADWSLFMALERAHGGVAWTAWPEALRRRDPRALDDARRVHADEIALHDAVQHLFARQWRRVRDQARARGIEILGDLPIYVAHDSADVWAHQHLFDLDADGRPRHVSGVPPDAFSDTGQLWGHPLYDWDAMDREGYQWWVDRLRAALRQADGVRLDHFRAFAGYWQIPADAETAVEGRWIEGPGRSFFEAIEEALGALPILAEDLGEITHDVHALRRGLGLPGMRVLQFGLAEDSDVHAPDRHTVDSVVYTGTHDNDTSVGWYRGLDLEQRERFHRVTGATLRGVHWTMIDLAYASVARLAVVPMQDVLGLGSEARMNTPGEPAGNWRWRLRDDQLRARDAARLAEKARSSGRAAARISPT